MDLKRNGKRKARAKRLRKFENAVTWALGLTPARRRPAALPVISIRLRKTLLAMASLAVVAALWVGIDDRFYIAQADVRGAVHTAPGQVFHASGLPGLHILWVRPAVAERRILAALPNLAHARVRCGISLPRRPARCIITVTERQPRVMWEEGGQLWWIDADGVIFSAGGELPATSGGGRYPYLPSGWRVHGPLPRDKEGRLHERVRVALSELWNADPNTIAALQVPEELDYTPGRGLAYVSPQGWRVILGDGPGMERRLRVLSELTPYLVAHGWTPQFVDVRYPGAPYYSLTNEW